MHWLSFQADFREQVPSIPVVSLALNGLWYGLTILAILGAHELGHYLACRYYGISASLPYFLPVPFPLTGTAGAFIRIRQPITTKPALFDIGIAGPLAGFVVAVPALFLGLALSRVVDVPADFSGVSLGEPLLFKAAAWLVWGDGAGSPVHQPAPDGVRRVVRPAGDGAEPVPHRPVRRRAHRVRRARPPRVRGQPRDGRGGRRPELLLVVVDRVDARGGGAALRVRLAASADVGRGRAARSPARDARRRGARRLRALLHACADRAAGSASSPSSVSENTDRVDVDDQPPAEFRALGDGCRTASRISVRDGRVPLHEELRAVLALQPRQRRGRRPQHGDRACRPSRSRMRGDEVRRGVDGRRVRRPAHDAVDERHGRRIAHGPAVLQFLLEERRESPAGTPAGCCSDPDRASG